MDALIERDTLLRRMAALKEQNKKLEENTTTLHTDIFGDVDNLKAKVQEQEKCLNQRQELVIAQVQAYKLVQVDPIEPIAKATDKKKAKAIGIQINEPHALPSKPIQPTMSKLDLDLEKARKENEDLAKELERVENEAQATETRRKIQFLKSNSTLASWPNLSIPTPAFSTPALASGPTISL